MVWTNVSLITLWFRVSLEIFRGGCASTSEISRQMQSNNRATPKVFLLYKESQDASKIGSVLDYTHAIRSNIVLE